MFAAVVFYDEGRFRLAGGDDVTVRDFSDLRRHGRLVPRPEREGGRLFQY